MNAQKNIRAYFLLCGLALIFQPPQTLAQQNPNAPQSNAPPIPLHTTPNTISTSKSAPGTPT